MPETPSAERLLHDALLDAHQRGDLDALVGLYTRAASTADSLDAGCFFLTQAWIFALHGGHPDHEVLHARLHTLGRA